MQNNSGCQDDQLLAHVKNIMFSNYNQEKDPNSQIISNEEIADLPNKFNENSA